MPVVVNMFASWCTNCREELPLFAQEATALRGRVQFIGVNSQETGDGRSMAREFHLASSGFVLARDVGGSPAEGLHDALKARGMPVTAFYGADGTLLRTYRAQVSPEVLRTTLHDLYGIGA
jgi:thiol-disulfide isomerase/thioredoxin